MTGTVLSSWSTTRLGDITTKIGSGATPRGGKGSYKEAGISLIRSLNIYDFRFDYDDLAFLDNEQAARLSNVEVQPQDILLNITGASVARCCMVPAQVLPARVNQHVAIVRVDPEVCDPAFVFYCINSPDYKHHLLTLAQGGATREALTKQTIADFRVPVPPLSTQRKIASVLSAYDDLIENNSRRIEILEEMAQRIYREWFVHFRFPGHEKVGMVDSPLGPIPEGWEVVKLAEACDLVMGQSPKSEYYNTEGKGLPFHQGVTNFGSRFPTHRLYCTVESRIAEAGDILFSVRAPVGRINLTTQRIVIGRGLSAIRSRSDYQAFVYQQLKEEFQEEDSIGGGTIFKAVTKSDMQNIKVLQPEILLIQQFESFIRPMFKEIENLSSKNINLRHTRDLLLPKLISGEVDVERLDVVRAQV